MSFKWPSKDPDEILDYSIDWSRALGASTIISSAWYVDDANDVKTAITGGAVVNNIQNVSQTVAGKVTTIFLGLGTNNVEYKFYCAITDSSGRTFERVVRLKIKEQ